MDDARIEKLLEAARWLRLSGDLEGAGKLYEQIVVLDPENATAADFLSGRTLTSVPLPQKASSNPFQRKDAAGAAPPAGNPLDLDWGMYALPGVSPAPPASAPPAEVDFDLSWNDGTPAPHTSAPAADADDSWNSETPPPPTSAPAEDENFDISWRDETPAPTNAPEAPAELDLSFEGAKAAPESPYAFSEQLGDAGPPIEATSRNPLPPPSQTPQTSAWNEGGVEPGEGVSFDVSSEVSASDPLDLVAESALLTSPPTVESKARDQQKREVQTLLAGARDLVSVDDHTGAMDLLMKAEALAPDDAEVQGLKQRSEQTLLAMFESKLGDLLDTPRVVLGQDEIIWLNLDHRAGFVLAQIDGTVSYDDLFALSGMSRFDTARILAQLVDEGVIAASGR